MPTKSDFAPVQVADEPFPPKLLSAIWQHFSQNPDKLALVCSVAFPSAEFFRSLFFWKVNAKAPTTDCVSYGELYVFSLACAAFLQRRGFGAGDVACLVLPNCWEYSAIFLGVGLQGGAISGANPMFTESVFLRLLRMIKSKHTLDQLIP
jgi:acyl-CoA synthetase (AMP-forming)/AMP-acid ligase II